MSKGSGWAVLVVLTGALLLSGGATYADTITNGPGGLVLSNCGDPGSACPAATYTFSIDLTTHQASLTIAVASNATLVTSGKQENNYISGIDLGFTTGSNVTSITNISAPGSDTWTTMVGSLNNNGCGVNSGAFVCLSAPTGALITAGNSYTWMWNFTLQDYTNVFPEGNVHIGANYNPAMGEIVSCTAAGSCVSVPEPGTLSLLGAGLLFLIGIGRRRLANS